MKHGFNIIIGAMLTTLIGLTACSKSGGGGSASTPPASATAGCILDAQGNCTVGVGAAGYLGDGQWSGRLMVNNITLYQNFAYENRLCGGQDCSYLSGYLNARLILQNGGCLPGPGNFAISTFSQGYQGRTLSKRGDAYMNNTNNGFLINYTSVGNTGTYAGQPTGTQGLGTMQINTQFTDATHNVLNVQIMYRGQQIASGQAFGQSQFNPTGAAQSAAYCGSGQGFGAGYAPGTGYYGPGGYATGGYQTNPYPVSYVGGGSSSGGGYIYYRPYSK